MKKLGKKYSREAGSLMMEAALVIPLILWCCWLIFSAISATQTDQLIRYAGEQVVSELALTLPMVDAVATESDVLPADLLSDLLKITESENIFREVGDLASSVILGSHINRRLDYWLTTAIQANAGKLPSQKRKVLVDLALQDHYLKLKVHYTVSTPWHEAWRQADFFVPLWTRYDLSELMAESRDSADDNIWSADNFTRGKYFRKQIGANLPFNFPVVCKVEGQAVTAMRSMDLTAPGYGQLEEGERQIAYEISRLVNFSGAIKGKISIQSVSNRELILIIPNNTPKIYNEAWRIRQSALALEQGVQLKFIERGKSRRYQSEEKE